MMGRKTARYFAGATVLVGSLALTAPAAFAQTPPEAAPERTGGVGELIVTARKREESLQDVPMAVSAISGDTLEQSGQSNLADLGHLAPNVFFEAADRSRPYIYIRGIGTRAYDPGSDSSVGVFIDGVYQARLATLDMDLLDVERVEVLRGPQGTLYGKNTIAGAISVITRDPTTTFRARANAEYGQGAVGDDNLYGVWGDLSGPLSESASASLAVAHRYRDGYQPVSNFDDVAGGSEDSWSLRGKLKIDLSDTTDLRLAGWYNDASGPPIIFVLNTLNGTAPTALALAPGVINPPAAPPYHPASDRSDIHLDKEVYGASASLDWVWSNIDFTAITAYQHLTIDEIWDGDASTVNANWASNPEESDQVSTEFRMSQTTDRMSWLFGLFYAKETADRADILYFGPGSFLGFAFGGGGDLVFDLNFDLETTSYAGFGQFTYNFTDHISSTIGARYSVDEKHAIYASNYNALLTSFRLDLPTQHWESFDPSVSVTYRFNDDISAYGSVSTGYKSGAFQFAATTAVDAAIIARPESVTSYEIGLKSTIFDDRMRFNAVIFHMDYQDLQTLRVVPTVIGGRVRLVNAEEATIDGVEIETLTALGDDWTVGLNYSYLDATFGNYIFNQALGLDFSGNRMQRAPENTINASIAYNHEYTFGAVNARLGYYWRDEIFFEADNNEIDRQSDEPARGLVDASIALSNDAWTLTLWGTNLTDERYRRTVLNSTGVAQRELWAEPRTIGVRLGIEFQ